MKPLKNGGKTFSRQMVVTFTFFWQWGELKIDDRPTSHLSQKLKSKFKVAPEKWHRSTGKSALQLWVKRQKKIVAILGANFEQAHLVVKFKSTGVKKKYSLVLMPRSKQVEFWKGENLMVNHFLFLCDLKFIHV